MILNYLGHENLSGARHGYADRSRGRARARNERKKGEICEISGGDAGNVRVGTTRSCTDDQNEDQEVQWALVGTKMRMKVVALTAASASYVTLPIKPIKPAARHAVFRTKW